MIRAIAGTSNTPERTFRWFHVSWLGAFVNSAKTVA